MAAIQVFGEDERNVQKKYWIEHSIDLTLEAMMLDCKASDLDKEERPEVIGLSKSGRAAAKLALIRGASVVAVDKNVNLVPLEQDSTFEDNGCVKTVLGDCRREVFENVDRVVASPGVPVENYGLSSLLQSGRRVMSELDFAAEVLPKDVKVLAITGTNGKSTVTTFAGQMLRQLGIKAFVGGNLGEPLSESAIQCLTSPNSESEFQVAVIEVSSYQMELPNNHFCPSVAVILNLTPDHLERHKTMKNYAATKCRIFSHMSFSKVAILPVVVTPWNSSLLAVVPAVSLLIEMIISEMYEEMDDRCI